MKILLTGGGTAGHFYPLIAIAEEIQKIAEEQRLLGVGLYYMSTTPYDKKLLFDNGIEFRRTFSGKRRLYFSFRNFTDFFTLGVGIIKALWSIFFLFPDVIISKGGYASVPALVAARILRIPIIIHESDSVPGRTNLWASRFAERVAVSWPEAARHFPKEKIAVTGQPVRKSIMHPAEEGAHEYLKLEHNIPVILILGGSQGAKVINETILDILPELTKEYQIIHQVGESNVKEISGTARVILAESPTISRYKPFGFLNDLAMKMAAGASSLVVSRAGSAIFEIAAWKKPSILIPITSSHADHQRRNAFNYARAGACRVVEEQNLTAHVLLAEIKRIMDEQNTRETMIKAAEDFFVPDAARKIAEEALTIALEHEQ